MSAREFVLPLLAAGALLLSACDGFCWGGGSPDPPPVNELFAVELALGPDSATIVRQAILQHNIWQFNHEDTLRRGLVDVSPAGDRLIVGRTVYTFPEAQRSVLPDSVTGCRWLHASPVLVCAVVAPDTLRHPGTGASLRVAAARTRVELRTAPGEAGAVLWADTARFVASTRYRLALPGRPAVSWDDRSAAFVRSVQTREVVLDASGAVVNDVVYAASVDALHHGLGEPGRLAAFASFLDPAARSIEVVLSPDGTRAAFAHDRKIYVATVGGGEAPLVLDGFSPAFGGDGSMLFYLRDLTGISPELVRVDLPDGAQQVVATGGRALAVDPAAGRAVYATTDGLSVYDVATGRTRAVFQTQRFLDAQKTSSSTVSGFIHHVVVLPGRPGHVLALGTLRRYTRFDDGC